MRVVVAPDKFKGSATAAEAAEALAAGLRRVKPGLDVAQVPVADGGDGTVAAALAAGFDPVVVSAEGPVGQRVQTTFAIRDGTAVIEMADVAGLRRLPAGFAPLAASTYGVGQVIAAALAGGGGNGGARQDGGGRQDGGDRPDGANRPGGQQAGPSAIVLGIGGSATTDGGAGMLQALGVRLTRDDGQEIGRGGAALADLAAIDVTGLDPRLGDTRILVASDVDNPLLGPSGAAAVFGPQKGAGEDDIAVLEAALARWAALSSSATGRDVAGQPGAGAAGGIGFAALAYLDARVVPGAELVLDLVGFGDALAGAELVITGEGSLDRQSLGGKAPVGVARAAAARGVPVIVVAGRVELTAAELQSAGFERAYSLIDLEPDESASMAKAGELLAAVGAEIGKDLR